MTFYLIKPISNTLESTTQILSPHRVGIVQRGCNGKQKTDHKDRLWGNIDFLASANYAASALITLPKWCDRFLPSARQRKHR
jgi:hypothetical protein